MGLEAATFISQLAATNPVANDKKNQGDDHLRLIKQVLQNSLPNADRPFRIPEVVSKNASYVAVEADDNKTILCDTTATAFNITLPAPTYDGWCVRVIKSSYDVRPVFVFPPSGFIGTPVGNLTRVRVNVPTVENIFFWTGASFIRLTGVGESIPGQLLDCGGGIPVGYEQAQGQSLLRGEYPETFSVWGTLYGSADANTFNAPNAFDQFTVGAGATYPLGARAGAASHVIAQANLPNVNLTTTIGAGQGTHTHGTQGTKFVGGTQKFLDGAGFLSVNDSTALVIENATLPQMTGSTPLGGSGTAINHVPPYLAMNKIFRKC